MPPLTHTSYVGVRENVTSFTGVGVLCGDITATYFHLGTWGPAVIMDGPCEILSGSAPPGYAPFVCPSSGNDTYFWMVGTATTPGIYTYTARAHLSNGSNFDVDCEHTVYGVGGIATLSGGTTVGGPGGSYRGGTTVTITGRGFTGAPAVKFGGTSAPSFAVLSDTEILAVTPPHAVGLIDVEVVGVGTLANAFSFVGVTRSSPKAGTVAGGTPVTLTGFGFAAASSVLFGGVPATSVVVVSNTTITAVTPPHASGCVEVEVVGVDTSDPCVFRYTLPVPQTLGKGPALPPIPTRSRV